MDFWRRNFWLRVLVLSKHCWQWSEFSLFHTLPNIWSFCLCRCRSRWWSPVEGARSPATGVTGSNEPLGAGNWTQALHALWTTEHHPRSDRGFCFIVFISLFSFFLNRAEDQTLGFTNARQGLYYMLGKAITTELQPKLTDIWLLVYFTSPSDSEPVSSQILPLVLKIYFFLENKLLIVFCFISISYSSDICNTNIFFHPVASISSLLIVCVCVCAYVCLCVHVSEVSTCWFRYM